MKIKSNKSKNLRRRKNFGEGFFVFPEKNSPEKNFYDVSKGVDTDFFALYVLYKFVKKCYFFLPNLRIYYIKGKFFGEFDFSVHGRFFNRE